MRKIHLDRDILVEEYVHNKRSAHDIADHLGVSRQTVANKLKEYDIPLRSPTELRSVHVISPYTKKVPRYKLKAHFLSVYRKVRSLKLVAEYYGISVDTAFNWKTKHNIATLHGASDKAQQRMYADRPWMDKELLSAMYGQYSTYELAAMWGCASTTVQKRLKHFGIPVRSPREQWDKQPKSGRRFDTVYRYSEYADSYAVKGRLPQRLLEQIKELVGKCQACPETEVLDLHHIDEDNCNNLPTNHVILCPNCHARLHRLGRTVAQLCPDYVPWSSLVGKSSIEGRALKPRPSKRGKTQATYAAAK